MKKNKNGFTLIEILVTIGILAVLTTIVGVSFARILHNNKAKEIDSFAEIVEQAACAYIDYHSINESICNEYQNECEVTYKELLDGEDSLVPDESNTGKSFVKKDLVNPEGKKGSNTIEDIVAKDANAVAVDVKFENGEKICEYRDLPMTAR